jgi:hypothetical protein
VTKKTSHHSIDEFNLLAKATKLLTKVAKEAKPQEKVSLKSKDEKERDEEKGKYSDVMKSYSAFKDDLEEQLRAWVR